MSGNMEALQVHLLSGGALKQLARTYFSQDLGISGFLLPRSCISYASAGNPMDSSFFYFLVWQEMQMTIARRV
jgi:hypothetical protein